MENCVFFCKKLPNRWGGFQAAGYEPKISLLDPNHKVMSPTAGVRFSLFFAVRAKSRSDLWRGSWIHPDRAHVLPRGFFLGALGPGTARHRLRRRPPSAAAVGIARARAREGPGEGTRSPAFGRGSGVVRAELGRLWGVLVDLPQGLPCAPHPG